MIVIADHEIFKKWLDMIVAHDLAKWSLVIVAHKKSDRTHLWYHPIRIIFDFKISNPLLKRIPPTKNTSYMAMRRTKLEQILAPNPDPSELHTASTTLISDFYIANNVSFIDCKPVLNMRKINFTIFLCKNF